MLFCPDSATPFSVRTSVHDPDYTYPPSRNPYWLKIKGIEGRVFTDNSTETHRGSWRNQFPDQQFDQDRKLHVELGCNAGHVILEWAARNPRDAYIGLDWKFKQIYRGVEKTIKRNVGNLIFFRAYSERLPFMFAPGEVDHLYIYFPDPWPRKSQWKNRYVTAGNLTGLARITRTGGTLDIKTDHAGYFEWMERELRLVEGLWKITNRSTDLHGSHPDPTRLEIPEVTLFERIFIRQKVKIHRVLLQRTAESAEPVKSQAHPKRHGI